jgi:hypothetical protein
LLAAQTSSIVTATDHGRRLIHVCRSDRGFPESSPRQNPQLQRFLR